MSHRFLPHTADIMVEITAPTFDQLLAEAVVVVRRLLAGAAPVAATAARTLGVAGSDRGDLLFQFVRELLYQFGIDGFVPARVELDEIKITRGGPAALAGTVFGERFDPARHQPQPEVKAVTRHALELTETEDGFRAEVLFDV